MRSSIVEVVGSPAVLPTDTVTGDLPRVTPVSAIASSMRAFSAGAFSGYPIPSTRKQSPSQRETRSPRWAIDVTARPTAAITLSPYAVP